MIFDSMAHGWMIFDQLPYYQRVNDRPLALFCDEGIYHNCSTEVRKTQGEACQTFIGSGDFSAMIVEIINTGSELMLGRVLNTHQQWLCQQFANLGYVVKRQVCVADTAEDIQMAVREALSRADLVVTTGGLGPTSDDITRDLIAQLLGRKLVRDEAVAARITGYFAGRKRPMPQSVLVQAMVPEGATVLPNASGTAPGLAMFVDKKWLVMLPGPPRSCVRCFWNRWCRW